jgi:hypothetical protein
MDMQTALQATPGVRLRTTRRAEERAHVTATFETSRTSKRAEQHARLTASFERWIDGVVAPLIKKRRVLIQRAGDIYKARYEGNKDAAFGETPSKAASNLRLWDAPNG